MGQVMSQCVVVVVVVLSILTGIAGFSAFGVRKAEANSP